MNNKVYRYIALIFHLASSVLILTRWFTVSAVGNAETHSFMTIPGMLSAGADFLTQIAGKSIAVTVLILSGILEYMCLLACGFGIWGVWRTFTLGHKSRFFIASQLISVSLAMIAFITIVMINFLSETMLGDAVSLVPTIWFILAVSSLVVSLVCEFVYEKKQENENTDL